MLIVSMPCSTLCLHLPSQQKQDSFTLLSRMRWVVCPGPVLSVVIWAVGQGSLRKMRTRHQCPSGLAARPFRCSALSYDSHGRTRRSR